MKTKVQNKSKTKRSPRPKKPAPPARARGRRPSLDPRRPSHIPLNTTERKKLQDAALAMGLPYATWARGTLLIVADWPATAQPIRMGGMGVRSSVPHSLVEAGLQMVLKGTSGEGGES